MQTTKFKTTTLALMLLICSNLFGQGKLTDDRPVVIDDDINWLFSRTYDVSGNLQGAEVSYFNCLGKVMQSQSRDVKTERNWAREVRYDYQGRPALSTNLGLLSGIDQDFLFNTSFIKKSNGSSMTTFDLEVDPEHPPRLSETFGTVGWYYSENNNRELFQDVADGRPYIRNVYDEYNPGKVRAIVGGKTLDTNNNGQLDGLLDEYPQGYVYTMSASQELYYAFGQDYFNAPGLGESVLGKQVILKSFKTVTIDAQGNEFISFIDKEGKTLATAVSGGSVDYEVVYTIGNQGYIDVHFPKDMDMNYELFGWTGYTIVNLRTGQELNHHSEMSPGNIYRISHAVTGTGQTYIEEDGTINAEAGAKGIRYKVNYHDFNLKYYDDNGRLYKSIQPLGFDTNAFDLSLGTPSHSMSTAVNYSALGFIESTTHPDRGQIKYVYRSDGQIRFSQDDQQAEDGLFAYTNYDNRGRPVESGISDMEVPFFPTLGSGKPGLSGPDPNPDTFIIDPASTSERSYIAYDVDFDDEINTLLETSGATINEGFRSQRHIVNNVSKTWTEAPNTNSTYYSYDVYGRVSWIVQDIEGLGGRTIDYTFDPIQNVVSKIDFQKDAEEGRFIHKYTYNESGQLIKVETSTDNINFHEHAEYTYYETGNLKRVNLADGLQGTDYIYNLGGQLKAINHPSLSNSSDPGQDTNDAFGLILDYYENDYLRSTAPIGATNSGHDRYDGKIKTSRWGTATLSNPGELHKFSYTYNKKGWLQGATFGNESLKTTPNYSVSNITYDANGNILTLNRTKGNDGTGNHMDDLEYNYLAGSNKLGHVDDTSGNLDEDGDLKDQNPGNYIYNDIGQLIENEQDELGYSYYSTGLVKSVFSTVPLEDNAVNFYYNERGHRVKKENIVDGSVVSETYYIRDINNMPIEIHIIDDITSGSPIVSTENTISGHKRLGMAIEDTFVYELTDHLGNVRAVIKRDETIPPVLDENFDDGIVPTWSTPDNTILAVVDQRLKVSALNNIPDPVKAHFNVESGHQYLISFDLDLSETENNLSYFVDDGSGGSVWTNGDATSSGTYSFTHIAVETETVDLVFKLLDKAFSTGPLNQYYLDNVKIIDLTLTNMPVMLAYKDYYPFGMPMPDRNIEGEYRYAFQGQEKDPETGMEAFELRLWDARIGRWLTVDPYNQFASSYLGMGNDPINGIDGNGGFWEELSNFFDGKGWNSNAALEYQANGGVLGEWKGGLMNGYREAHKIGTYEEGLEIVVFRAKDDFKEGLFSQADVFNINGRVAIGYAGKLSGDLESSWAKFGVGGSIGGQSMMYIGGDYGYYWYDYLNFEVGPNAGLSVAAGPATVELTAEAEMILSIYVGDEEGSPNPDTMAGYAGSIDGMVNVDYFIKGDLGGGVTFSKDWISFNVTLGVGLSSTPEAGVTASARGIKTVMVTQDIKPTVERSWGDIILNHLRVVF